MLGGVLGLGGWCSDSAGLGRWTVCARLQGSPSQSLMVTLFFSGGCLPWG